MSDYVLQPKVVLNGAVAGGVINGGVTTSPWGTPPMRKVALSSALDGTLPDGNTQGGPSLTWAITDADQALPVSKSVTSYSSLPAQPVHGSYRNTLFFDMHAEQRSTSLFY